jgi:hypothetical protein
VFPVNHLIQAGTEKIRCTHAQKLPEITRGEGYFPGISCTFQAAETQPAGATKEFCKAD